METANLLVIDIETVPQCRSYEALPPALQKHWDRKSTLLDPQEEDKAKTFLLRAGVYAEFAKIICIGLGYFTGTEEATTLHVKTLHGDDERDLLQQFYELSTRFFSKPGRQFCGHNIREFDIPFLCRRFLVNRLPLPAILKNLQSRKPWENPMLDTLQYWKFGEYKNFTSVDLLAALLEVESPKQDMDGSEVGYVYWQEAQIERIARYCSRDVVAVAQIYQRLNGRPLLDQNKIIFADTNHS